MISSLQKKYRQSWIVRIAAWILVACAVLAVIAGTHFLQSASLASDSCSKFPELQKRECWKQEIVSALESKGIDAAFDLLAKLYASDPSFSLYCHDYTHIIGDAAYKQFSKNKTTELSPQASYCGYGFYHGFMEALLYTTGDIQQARDFCSYAQEQLGGDAKGACYHGIGHGFLDGTNRDGWGNAETMVSEGLALCERVGESPYFINRCASGVFNSLAILSDNPSQKDSIETDKNDPYGICRLQKKSYFKTPCYEEMNTLVYRINKGDLSKAAVQIAQIADDADAASAMESLTSYSVRFSTKAFDGAAATSFCNSLESRLQIPCVKGFGTGLVEFGPPAKEYVQSLAFCQSPALAAVEQHDCLGRIVPYLRVEYTPEKMRSVCTEAVDAIFQKEFCP